MGNPILLMNSEHVLVNSRACDTALLLRAISTFSPLEEELLHARGQIAWPNIGAPTRGASGMGQYIVAASRA